MARRPRLDYPGSWHHVTNRAVGKRPLYEDRRDARFFLARLATQVRLGFIEVHCYCLMTTHFHLLVRSPLGVMSEALRRAQNESSRRFNLRHHRDGALVRGRFFSKPVESLAYRENVVRYIDANPVKAGIVDHPRQYELSSRAAYAREKRPLWLSRAWVEGEVMRVRNDHRYRPAGYDRAFGTGNSTHVEELVAARMASTAVGDPLDDLIGSAPEGVQEWLKRRARKADGLEIGLPVCGRTALFAALDEHLVAEGSWVVLDGRVARDAAAVCRVGMLRDLCGWSIDAILIQAGGSRSAVSRMIANHRRLLLQDSVYAQRAALVGQLAIRSLGTGHFSTGGEVSGTR